MSLVFGLLHTPPFNTDLEANFYNGDINRLDHNLTREQSYANKICDQFTKPYKEVKYLYEIFKTWKQKFSKFPNFLNHLKEQPEFPFEPI